MKNIVKEMRVKAWLKNVFVFVPIVFAQSLTDAPKLFDTALAFAAFCLVASSVYIFNDICDAKKDALHPVKRHRPVASGAVSIRNAYIFAVVLAMTGCAAGYAANVYVALIAFAYLALNITYTLWLKHRPVFDCFCIAAGFILRVYAGGAAINVGITDWLFLTIVVMSLFMAFGKRRGEMVKLSVESNETRSVLSRYDLNFLNNMMFVCAGLSITFYSLWAMNRGFDMIYTVPLIVFIVCKYLLLLYKTDSYGDPTTVIFSDRILLASCGIYALFVVFLLYGRVLL
jgi:4-hydroxybenzoate polyprenyltransferase